MDEVFPIAFDEKVKELCLPTEQIIAPFCREIGDSCLTDDECCGSFCDGTSKECDVI